MTRVVAVGVGLAAALFGLSLRAAPAPVPAVSLQESLRPSPLRRVSDGPVLIRGSVLISNAVPVPAPFRVRVRVTSSLGTVHEALAPVRFGRFVVRFPEDFPLQSRPGEEARPSAGGPGRLAPQLLYVDATDDAVWDGPRALQHQAEATLVLWDDGSAQPPAGAAPSPRLRVALPDLPMAFTDDFIDARGRKDAASAQWPSHRLLIERFRHGRAARLMGLHDPGFRLDDPAGFSWFKDHAALYDFDHRDRDWSTPLGNRVARGFWQAVWNRWFNASNNHPWDGNPANRTPDNYRPYTFANDAADLLVLHQMLRRAAPRVADNRQQLVNEVLANLLALQHRGADNFALQEASGAQEHYTAGAFRYGMFETGEWLTEGKGWFHNPRFRDFVRGGVFNGRAVWALGESLRADPQGPLAGSSREALRLALRFCLHDGLAHRYTRVLPSGLRLWNAPAGEHGYLVLGLLAAAATDPDLLIPLDPAQPAVPLRRLARDSLDALAEIARPDGTWSRYPNADAVNIAALAEGARTFPDLPGAGRWRSAAARAADYWMALRPDPAERSQPTPHFGYRPEARRSSKAPSGPARPDTAAEFTSFRLGNDRHAHIPLYIGGHWIHALAVLHAVTGDPRHADRAHALLAYYCGDNPLHARLLNELGAIHNRVTDADDDGLEDTLSWDAYPESTAFVQIGLLHLIDAVATPRPR